jgi:hypothetical protein
MMKWGAYNIQKHIQVGKGSKVTGWCLMKFLTHGNSVVSPNGVIWAPKQPTSGKACSELPRKGLEASDNISLQGVRGMYLEP